MSLAPFPMVSAPCLGEGDYTCRVVTRPTPGDPRARVIGELLPRSLNWNRNLDQTATADITVGVSGTTEWSACCDVVNQIRPGRTNIEFYRDGDLVFLGPIVTASYDPQTQEVTLACYDLSIWLSWRLFVHTMKPRHIDLSDIFVGYMNYALKGIMPEWGVLKATDRPLVADDPGLEFEAIPTGVLGDRTVANTDLRIVSVEIEELSRTGVDWTVTNRKMWIGGAELMSMNAPPVALRLPTHVTDDFFATSPRTRVTAEGMVTEAWVRANGHLIPVGGPDPDGLLIQRVLDESSIEDIPSATAAANSYYAAAHDPLTFIEGDNSLAASAPVDIQTLIPGTRVDVDLTGGGCIPYAGALRLEGVSVNLSPDAGELVNLAMQPLGTSFDARGLG